MAAICVSWHVTWCQQGAQTHSLLLSGHIQYLHLLWESSTFELWHIQHPYLLQATSNFSLELSLSQGTYGIPICSENHHWNTYDNPVCTKQHQIALTIGAHTASLSAQRNILSLPWTLTIRTHTTFLSAQMNTIHLSIFNPSFHGGIYDLAKCHFLWILLIQTWYLIILNNEFLKPYVHCIVVVWGCNHTTIIPSHLHLFCRLSRKVISGFFSHFCLLLKTISGSFCALFMI